MMSLAKKSVLAAAALLTSAGMAEAAWRVVYVKTPYYKVVNEGQRIKLDSLTSLDPSCHSLGRAQVNLLAPPRGGQVELSQGPDFPYYVQANVRSACNKRRVPATLIYYHAGQNYTGEDSFAVEIVYPSGNAQQKRYVVNVR